MKKFWITQGTNLYDLFIIPTIRFDKRNFDFNRLTIEWLKWYVGIAWEKEKVYRV